MNKFTKIILGTGLAVAALGAIAAPANAAVMTTTSAVDASTSADTHAAGDRVEGKLVVRYTGQTTPVGKQYFIGFQPAAGAGQGYPAGLAGSMESGLASTSVFSIPARGETGPVIDSNGMCVTAPSVAWERTRAEACDGSAAQQFRFHPTNYSLNNNGNSIAMHNGYMVMAGGTSSFYWVDERPLAPVVAPAVVPVDITNATTDTRPVFSGTGDVGATVEITLDDGTVVGSTTVGTDGKWTIPSTIDIAAGDTHFTATQTATDNSVTTDDITVTILGTPVIDPLIAGGSALALLAVAGGVLVKRRQTAGAAA